MSARLFALRERIECRLRGWCGRIAPENRAAVVLTALAVFGCVAIGTFVSALWRIGRSDEPQIEVEHLRPLDLRRSDTLVSPKTPWK